MPSIYVHVPFCERKCAYCDFYSVEGLDGVEPYLAALSEEIVRRAPAASGAHFQTVFLGGGTPSLLSPEQLERIFRCLRSALAIEPDAEITLEANPGTLTAAALPAYRRLGVNRISLGIQSFLDAELALLGRIHTSAEARTAVGLARAAGFGNLGLDLIYGIPGQSLTDWKETLHAALALEPEHVSAYALTYEADTPLARAFPPPKRTGTELERAMQLTAVERLEAAGFERYEVSNFARPGFRCRHNWGYWSHERYLGFGPSAHSFWSDADSHRDRRWGNTRNLSAYVQQVRAGRFPLESEEWIGPTDLLRERIVVGLRTGRLDLAQLATEFGYDIRLERAPMLEGLVDGGLATCAENLIRLTPAGYLVVEEIARRFLP